MADGLEPPWWGRRRASAGVAFDADAPYAALPFVEGWAALPREAGVGVECGVAGDLGGARAGGEAGVAGEAAEEAAGAAIEAIGGSEELCQSVATE